MERVADSAEVWDRLTLLLIAHPQQGWEALFEEIVRREIERLCPPAEEVPGAAR